MTNPNATTPYRNTYGTHETNALVNGPEYHAQERETVDWSAKGLQVTRLRLLTDHGCDFYDVSYCDGRIGNKLVKVELPFTQLPRRNTIAAIIKYAQSDKVFAKATGILNPANWSTLV